MKKKQNDMNVQQSLIDSINWETPIISSINSMPEFMFVGRCGLRWASVYYKSYGLGLACFLSQKDAENWFDTQEFEKIDIVEVSALEAMSIASQVDLKYIHLLSNEWKNPLCHFPLNKYKRVQ